jgi:hypothetical protein
VHLPAVDVRASWHLAAEDAAISSGAIERMGLMEIGKPVRKIVVEPIRNPVPERTPKPSPEPAPARPAPARTRV